MSLEIDSNKMMLALSALRIRMNEQMGRMTPPLFTFDRNGLRLAIAALEDETNELWDEWNHNKRNLGNVHENIEHELLDIAAVAMITFMQAMEAKQNGMA